MSEIKVNSIKGVAASTAAITVNNTNGTCAVNNTQRQGKNLVINGGMLCSQRGTTFSQVGNTDITLARFGLIHPYSTHFDVSQSTDSPDGFSKSYKLDINVVDSSIGTGQFVAIRHKIEAQNLQQLAFGTSSAKSISLSFYVKSNKTGTFAVNIQQTDNSSKQVSAPFTISSANTWERKTFTFAGDTSGVINDDNGTGLTILWWLSAGSTYNSGTSRSTFTAHADADSAVGCNVNILDSTDNNFFLTGVQLETSDAASDFEYRSFGQELQLCKRYCQVLQTNTTGSPFTRFAVAIMQTTSSIRAIFNLSPEMRTIPSATKSGNFQIFPASGFSSGSFNIESGTSNFNTAIFLQSSGMSGTAGSAHYFSANGDADAKIIFDAEL